MPHSFRVGNLFDEGGEGSRMGHSTCGRLRIASDMQLVNDGIAHRAMDWHIAFPIVGCRIYHDAAHRSFHVVIRPASSDAVPKGIRVSFGVGVDEHLVFIEPMAQCQWTLILISLAILSWTIHSVSVVRARSQTANIDVPEE